MRSRRFIFFPAAVAVLIAAIWMLFPIGHLRDRDKLVIAESRQIMSALISVAEADGHFAQQGLAVELLPVANGRMALQTMLDGRADLALSSDVPAANAIATGQPIRLLATVETSDRDVVVASPAGNEITRPDALAGRRVGFVPGTNSEYFLGLLLRQNGLSEQVTRVPLESDAIMQALYRNEVDAVSVWTTLRITSADMFPQGFDVLALPGLYTESWILSTRADVVQERSDTLRRLEKALLAAEQTILHDREHAIPIVAAATGISPALVRAHWDNYGFTLRLDQALLLSLEAHVRRAGGNPGPELLDFLQLDLLKSVDPSRVTILD
ncbi:ABC transporter substrate-binding protein [Niveispirillum fermenti]|uniref:ABC transporter substrate-binding protein n=1 Tax=Niveispirillum fermenti TaxID=1233113 RepID=UPI003A89282E